MGGKLKPGRKGTQRFFDRKRRRRSAGKSRRDAEERR